MTKLKFKKIHSITPNILNEKDILYFEEGSFFIIPGNTQEEEFVLQYPSQIYFRHYELEELFKKKVTAQGLKTILEIKRLFHPMEVVPKPMLRFDPA